MEEQELKQFFFNLTEQYNTMCVKWSYLIAKRTKKVKCLTCDPNVSDSSDVVYYQSLRSIDLTCLSKLFTNLKIFNTSHIEYKDAIKFVRKQESLKGLINPFDEPIEKYCDKLEMLSVYNFNPKNLQDGSILKQLDIWSYSLKALGRDAHYLPNLEILKVEINDYPEDRYHGPVLEKLKILELSFFTSRPGNFFNGFHLMDSCPNLQSAHIFMRADTWFFDETLKHKCLRDLVIQFYESTCENGNNTCNNLKRLLMKYPNLKHLGLRSILDITDEHIEQLVHILPNLVLLDVRKCNGVTRRAADYVKDYFKRYGRSIKFYFNGNRDEIKSDWPHLSSEYTLFSRDLDFMKHCFFRDHMKLPFFYFN